MKWEFYEYEASESSLPWDNINFTNNCFNTTEMGIQ